jgi:hypothetical protein
MADNLASSVADPAGLRRAASARSSASPLRHLPLLLLFSSQPLAERSAQGDAANRHQPASGFASVAEGSPACSKWRMAA